ncbi:hypothetical protein [Streptomyces sp. N35]|uniref:hypothetical protein n=1 Tax=Streptomyces sp. N35 TaxID=2795730 RepID=UPI0018F61AC6|nr:hypothetical protein [Streptomyces sp. N35]
MTREQWDAEEAAWYREIEFLSVQRRLHALYAAQTAGDDTTLTRQKIDRLERLTQALCGSPEQLGA